MSPPPGKSGSGDSVYLKKKKATDGDSSDFERIETETDLFRCLEGHSLGEEVKVRVIRRVAVEGGYFPEEVILRLKLTVSSGGRVLDTVDTVNSK
jgi:hypothetical protein